MDYSQEHVNAGIISILDKLGYCVYCHKVTKFYEPLNRIYLCSINCFLSTMENINKAEMDVK